MRLLRDATITMFNIVAYLCIATDIYDSQSCLSKMTVA